MASRFAEFEVPPWRTADEIAGGTAKQLAAAVERGNDERSAIFVAENPDPVGFAWVLLLDDFYTGEPIGKVSEIAAARSGMGVGQALMAECERWARERGARLMTLNALEGNAYARRFYELYGYAPEYTMYAKRLEDG